MAVDGGGLISGNLPVSFKASEMIEAHPIEKRERVADAREQPREVRHVAPRDPKLAGVGAPVFAHGRSFKPDELCPAAREAFVAPPSQLARTPIERAVAALHGLDGDGVPHGERAHAHGPRQHAPDFLRAGGEPDVRRAGLLSRAPQFVQSFVNEMSHPVPDGAAAARWPARRSPRPRTLLPGLSRSCRSARAESKRSTETSSARWC